MREINTLALCILILQMKEQRMKKSDSETVTVSSPTRFFSSLLSKVKSLPIVQAMESIISLAARFTENFFSRLRCIFQVSFETPLESKAFYPNRLSALKNDNIYVGGIA